MSAPDDTPDLPEIPEVLKRSAIPKAIVAVCVFVLVFIGLLAVFTRYGVLLPQARVMIEARADGLKIGRFGKLKIEGLSGDIWRDFSIRRLTVRDEQGVWLDAANVHMRWRYADLLRRRFTADAIEAQQVRVLRRPTLTAKGKDTGLPVSFQIDKAHARVEMLPEFSYRRGVYDLDLSLDVERAGGQRGTLRAASILHPGDHLNLDFDVAERRPLVLLADAEEAEGGALAGALGLPANEPFVLKIAAGGKTSEGRFSALATSGRLVPLSAQGAWTPTGGEARGRMQLTASTLTRSWAERFGDRAVFGMAGRKAGPNTYALAMRVYADNLALRADGLGDLGQQAIGPKGLALTASTPKLSRITGGPDLGAARINGVLTKPAAGWKFAGSGGVQKLQVGDYALAEASGPVEIATQAGAVSVTARLAGRGGQGTGLVAALLGAAPKASFEGARLADGRLAMKRLEVDGAGLKVDATGGRSLLGGLTFKGRADLTNLAAARTGASGSASAAWSAGQAGAGKPWVFTFDAKGAKFATGYAELDRLLGAQPRVAVQASLQDGRVSVARGALDGAAFGANTAGVLAADGGLTFKVDWTAQGPFRAGPVEIAGKARGSGALTGKLAEPRLDLIADVDQVDVPRMPLKSAHITLSFLRKADGSSGMVAATAVSPQGPARARADFRFPAGGVDLTGLSVDAGGLTAQGSVSLRSGAPSAADLQVAVTRGAFLDDGRVTGRVRIIDAPGGARATLDLNGVNLRPSGATFVLSRVRLNADGPLARLPYGAQAAGTSGGESWSFSGHGAITETRPGYAATFDGDARLGARDLHTVETAAFRFGGPERSARLRLAGSDGGRIDLDGRQTSDAADLKLTVAKLTLGLLQEDMTGQVDGTLALAGRGATLTGALDARVTDAKGRGAPASSAIDATVRGRLADQTLSIDAAATNDQGLKADGSLVLPTEASASPLHLAIARQRPMQGRFAAEGEVRPLWDLLIGGERSLAGIVRTQGTLGGTLAAPTASGQVTVERGRFDDGATGLSLRNVAMAARFDHDTVDVTQASGDDGHGGSVTGAGRISLEPEGVSGFRLNLKGFRLIDNEQATASASGQATIRRAATGKVTLAGALTIDRADVAADLPTPSGVTPMEVKEVNRPATLPASLPVAYKRGEGWALDVKLEGPRRVFLRGRGLDVELSLDAHVGGTSSHPALSGTARVVRGDYDFAGKRFEFDTRSVVYLASDAEDIRLDLTATREDPTLTAIARIRGTADKPEFSLTSTPSLPSDEILSQVLFGRSASQLSPLEAAQLASALASLSHGGGFDVIGNLRTFAGLDRLAFAGGGENGVSVAGGKYITEDVYLELIGDSKLGPAAQVEWRIKRSLSILSKVTGTGASKLSVRWRKDY